MIFYCTPHTCTCTWYIQVYNHTQYYKYMYLVYKSTTWAFKKLLAYVVHVCVQIYRYQGPIIIIYLIFVCVVRTRSTTTTFIQHLHDIM